MTSIRRGLLGWVLGAMAAGAVLLAAATYALTLNEMNEVFDEHLQQVAQAVALGLPAHDAAGDGVARSPPASTAADDEPGDFDFHTTIHDVQGRLLYRSHTGLELPYPTPPGLSRAVAQGEPWVLYTVAAAGRVVQVAQPLAARRELAADAALQLVAMLLAMMAMIALLLVWAVRRGLAPLNQAATALAGRSASALTPVADAGVPAELRPLVAAINSLLQRLAQAFTQQQRFVADAAHELRTPVTALRLQLQLLEQAGDADERSSALAELRGGIQRSQRLIEQLLALSRAEPGGEVLQFAPVALDDVVQPVVASRRAEALRRGLRLSARAAADCGVVGDRAQLQTLLGNLVDNALRFTPSGGTVQVHAEWRGQRPALCVVDDGPGIAEAEHRRVFDRFYRVPGAQPDEQAIGSGLGLAIVQTIAQRHHASVSLHAGAAGRGLEVRVVFDPGAAAAAASGRQDQSNDALSRSQPLRPAGSVKRGS